MFTAALYCADCTAPILRRLSYEGKIPEDPSNESSYDSDDYPKGPYDDGGGEADTPQHCAGCHEHLENSLTDDGVAYVREAIERAILEGKAESIARDVWGPFYGIEPEDPRAIRLARMTPAMREHADEKTGELDAYAWPGRYPVFYLLEPSNDVVCAKCANDPSEGVDPWGGDKIGAHDVNWEDPDLMCDGCNERIESAYAEDEAEKGEGDVEQTTE